MTNHEQLREQLVTRLATLTSRVERIERDLRSPGDRDWVERATEQENDEVLEGLDELTRAEALRLRRAIERIDTGQYGTCAHCGQPIEAARLAALPSATTCVRCTTD